MDEIKTKAKIKSFTDLVAWKQGHIFAISIYKVTQKFPKDELFGLTSQMRRASLSITSNISEGFSRNSWKEKMQFYSIALGSNTEIQNQLLLSRDIGILDGSTFNDLAKQTLLIGKLLQGLLKSTKVHRITQNSKY